MKFEEIKKFLKGIPHLPTEDAIILYSFILESKPSRILELGFDHGVSTLYMAAALDEIGSGTIITIDNHYAKLSNPSIYQLMQLTNLEKYINPIFANRSYTWELKKLLEKNIINNEKVLFDFCFIDGAHNWETDGFAFYLVDKLLNEGAFILFDDVKWNYKNSNNIPEEIIKYMGDDELEECHVELILKLLVNTHPDYVIEKIDFRWAWVRKISSNKIIKKIDFDKIYEKTNLKNDIKRIIKKILNF